MKTFANNHLLARCVLEAPTEITNSRTVNTGLAAGTSSSRRNSQSQLLRQSVAPITAGHAAAVVSGNGNSRSSATNDNDLWTSLDRMYEVAVNEVPVKAAAEMLNEELEIFMLLPPIPRNCNSLIWWKENKARMPTLALVARAVLAIPATQAKSERLNSVSGNVTTARAGTLTEHISELTFLHENLVL